MLKKLGIAGLLLTAFSVLIPMDAQATAHHALHRGPVTIHHPLFFPHGYYFHEGRWVPYRGPRFPYRGGYYDRWGRWHALVHKA